MTSRLLPDDVERSVRGCLVEFTFGEDFANRSLVDTSEGDDHEASVFKPNQPCHHERTAGVFWNPKCVVPKASLVPVQL